jgi:hypothetical protein
MFKNKAWWLYWIPRVLAVVFILFISLFALDVFSEYDTLREIIRALFMHLIPSFLLIIVTAIAWRWRLTGGILFVLLGLVSIAFFNTYWHIVTFLFISLPPILLGLLFIWESHIRPSDMNRNGL